MADETKHMDYLNDVCSKDILNLQLKESIYQGSWKKRGGVGAFMMLARKWDRIENMLTEGHFDQDRWDIFTEITRKPNGDDGTMLAEIRDLRRYLILVEAEMMARGIVDSQRGNQDVKEDSNKHAFQAEEPIHSGDKMGPSGISSTGFYNRQNDRDRFRNK